ncbi:MAG: hypothetical protein F6K41_18210 [Symploca sp. SIO3E6]|nr:hypothetical protein [Caldora sp. SIO3E6]
MVRVISYQATGNTAAPSLCDCAAVLPDCSVPETFLDAVDNLSAHQKLNAAIQAIQEVIGRQG